MAVKHIVIDTVTGVSSFQTSSELSSTLGSSGSSWGSITGTLSSQTDLQTALNGKQASGTYATGTGTASGTNTGDQTSIVGITGTIAQFNTACTDADFATGGGTASGTNTGDNAANSTYASDYRAANFVAGTNYVAPGGVLGTPSSGTLTNCTFPTLNQNTSGTAAGLSGTPALPNGTTATTQSVGDNSTKIATTAYARAVAPNASYRTLLDSSGSHTAAKVAGTYGLGHGDVAAVTGTGTLYPLNTIAIASADYPSVDGLAPKLRVRFNINCNDVAPFTGTFVCGLHPVTRPATSGGAGLVIYTIGAAVAGSTVTLTNPAADSANLLVGSDFSIPADGQYILAFVTNATMATSSHAHISASLQLRNA